LEQCSQRTQRQAALSQAPNEILIEQAVSAYRERDALGRIMPSRAWWDLPPDSRQELFKRQNTIENLEAGAGMDPIR
jgi:hypothetical protein